MNARVVAAGLGLLTIVPITAALAAPRPAASISYTAQQASDGRFLYINQCAECHHGDMTGYYGPALRDAQLSNIPWQTPKAVYTYMIGHMPVGNSGALPQRDYLAIMAYIMQQNGMREGKRPLTIRDINAYDKNLDGSTP